MLKLVHIRTVRQTETTSGTSLTVYLGDVSSFVELRGVAIANKAVGCVLSFGVTDANAADVVSATTVATTPASFTPGAGINFTPLKVSAKYAYLTLTWTAPVPTGLIVSVYGVTES